MVRMTIGIALGLALAGCKQKDADPSAGPAAPPAPPPPAIDAAAPAIDAAALRAAVPCPPDRDALRAAAEKIFALKGTIGDAQCASLFVDGSPRWLIELGYRLDDTEHFYAGLVNASTGQATWNDSYEAPEGVSFDKQEVVDLDGDGTDELLTTSWGGSHGLAWGTLTIRSVKDGKLYQLAELKLGHTNEGAVAIGLEKKPTRCESQVELIDGPASAAPTRQIVIVGAKHVGAPVEADCPKVGRHVYGYNGSAVAEVP